MNRIITLLILISSVAKSQCLSGTYTIGGSSPDYATFNNAVNAISTNGICGHVVFKVRPGTYVENVVIPNWSTSATKTVTFESETGVNTSVLLRDDSSYTLYISCKYVTIHQMSIEGTGSSSYGCIYIASPASDVVIKECKTNTTTGGVSGTGIQMTDVSNVTIVHNDIFAEGMGIASNGTGSAITLSNILIDSNMINVSLYNGIGLDDINGLAFTNNTLLCGTYPMLISNCSGTIQFARNKIVGQDDGIVFADFVSPVTLNVYNNMVRVVSTSFVHGLVLQGIPNANVHFNTVSVKSYASDETALLVSFAGNYNISNNIFVNTATGGVLNIQSGGTYNMDYNIYHTSGTNIGYCSGTISTLAWFTSMIGIETNGMVVDPLLVSATDLHIQSMSPARDTATSLVCVDDIDGQLREPLQDIGADEYYPPIGIEEYNSNTGFFAFPNPTTGKVTMKLNDPLIHSVRVYSVDGNFLGEYSFVNETIDLSHLVPGVYFLRCGYQTVKCIKE